MNIIARLEYELPYYDSAVHRLNHYTTRTPQKRDSVKSRGEKMRTNSYCRNANENKQNKFEISRMKELEQGIWHDFTNLDNIMLGDVKGIRISFKFNHKSYGKPEIETSYRKTNLSRCQNPKSHLAWRFSPANTVFYCNDARKLYSYLLYKLWHSIIELCCLSYLKSWFRSGVFNLVFFIGRFEV